jgi:hypothetical protein
VAVLPSMVVALSRICAILCWHAKMLIFLVDHPNETKKNLIAKFGYSGHPNNQIFGYLVIRVTQITKYLVIQLFSYSVIWVT